MLNARLEASATSVRKAPEIGTRVRIAGERGVYLVMRVDLRRYLADLMLEGPTAKVEQGVPFWAIESIGKTNPLGGALMPSSLNAGGEE